MVVLLCPSQIDDNTTYVTEVKAETFTRIILRMTRNISTRKFAGNFDFLLDKSIDVQKEKEKIEVADHSNNIPGLYST